MKRQSTYLHQLVAFQKDEDQRHQRLEAALYRNHLYEWSAAVLVLRMSVYPRSIVDAR